MINYETASKALAVAAAAVVAAWPYIPPLPARKSQPQTDEAAAVLAIARRLQAAGHKSGVSLCQQLLAVLLETSK